MFNQKKFEFIYHNVAKEVVKHKSNYTRMCIKSSKKLPKILFFWILLKKIKNKKYNVVL